jgi:hypothetical protein
VAFASEKPAGLAGTGGRQTQARFHDGQFNVAMWVSK